MRRRLPGVIIPKIDDLGEVKAMLAERWEQVLEEAGRGFMRYHQYTLGR